MAAPSTVSNTLTPQFRYVVLLLWILACAVVGWVAFSEKDLFARLLFGVPSLLGSALLTFFVQEESRLATNHLLVMGEVIACKRLAGRRGGIDIKYRFDALDGRIYEETSSVLGRSKFKPNDAIPILYHPLMPANSKPLAGFIFYRFNFPQS